MGKAIFFFTLDFTLLLAGHLTNLARSVHVSPTDCQRLCNAGTYSYNGQDNLDPVTGLSIGSCLPCDVGSYSSFLGAKQCQSCQQVLNFLHFGCRAKCRSDRIFAIPNACQGQYTPLGTGFSQCLLCSEGKSRQELNFFRPERASLCLRTLMNFEFTTIGAVTSMRLLASIARSDNLHETVLNARTAQRASLQTLKVVRETSNFVQVLMVSFYLQGRDSAQPALLEKRVRPMDRRIVTHVRLGNFH